MRGGELSPTRSDRPGERPDGDWDERATRWLAFDDELERFAAPLGELAMDALDLTAGERVLDVGCGTGRSSIAIADRVAPDGHVVGLDVARLMVERSRHNAAGRTNLDFVVADAARHDFGEPFDVVFSRFGVMFFEDPAAAFGNLRRALRPGGRLGFVSWADVRTNDWFMITGLAVLSVTRTQPRGVRTAPFSLAEPDRVAALLTEAGFRDVRAEQRIETMTMTEAELERRLALSIEVTGLREPLAELDPATRERAVAAVRRDLWSRVAGGRIALRVGVLVVTASR